MSADRCEHLDEVVAELALGLLDGAERAAALEHIERCGDCQAEVASLTAVGEQLLLLAPEVPPPAGFESRVLGKIAPAPGGLSPLGPSGAGRARWRLRPVLFGGAVAAAAVLVAVLVVVGGWLGSDGGGHVAARTTTEMLTPRGNVVGDATLWYSSPAVMEVDVSDWLDAMVDNGADLDDRWWLSVEAEDGDKEMYAVSLTSSPVEVTMDLAADRLVSVALVDNDGEVWCSGRFPT